MLDRHKGWIFDLDGTLTLAQHDFDAIRAELAVPPGRLILEFLDELPSTEAAPLRARLHAIELELAATAEIALGAQALIAELAHRGKRLGILTRNTRAAARIALSACGLDNWFAPELILGRDEAPPKPAAAGIHQLIRSWSLPADACLMVGDYRLDLEAGRNAGVTTVHVHAGTQRWPALTDHHFPTLAALLASLHAET